MKMHARNENQNKKLRRSKDGRENIIMPRVGAVSVPQECAPRVCAERVRRECAPRGCAESVRREGAKIVDRKAPYSTLWRIFFWEHTQVRWTELIEHSFICYTPSLRS